MTLGTERPGRVVSAPVKQVDGGVAKEKEDLLATEEPLEIRVAAFDRSGVSAVHRISVTMRTPGNDFELAAGFLFSEGVVRQKADVESIAYCTDPLEPQNYNVVKVALSRGVAFDVERLSRHVYTSSSCGICGKASIDLVRTASDVKPSGDFVIDGSTLGELPDRMREAQGIFSKTGGIHAAALFDADGELVLLREDVGRHNALDKVVGALLMEGRVPVTNGVLMVSGRTSFELVQKAVMAGIPLIAAVGAPSSLALSLAKEYGVTLAGFVRGSRFNVYSNGQRIRV